eukprot:15167446-Alexandrium_andersonii.AAC.1
MKVFLLNVPTSITTPATWCPCGLLKAVTQQLVLRRYISTRAARNHSERVGASREHSRGKANMFPDRHRARGESCPQPLSQK